MTGSNSLTLNQETMCEALRYWLVNAKLKDPVRVTKVDTSSDRSSYSGGNFVVTFEP